MDTNYVEEYFRSERVLTENPQRFGVDRLERIIFTTPFITDSEIVDDSLAFTGARQIPKNVQLVIDNITLLSTNPNATNYLPLKFDFGVKPQIEFGNTTATTLTDYELTVAPPINLQTISNFQWRPGLTKRLPNLTFDTNSIVNSVIFGDVVYFRTNDNYVYRYFILTDKYEEIEVTVDDVQLNWREIYSNSHGVVGLATNGQLYNFDVPFGGTPLLINSYGTTFIDLNLRSNTLIVFYKDLLNKAFIQVWVIDSTGYTQINVIRLTDTIFDNMVRATAYSDDRFFIKTDNVNNDIIDFEVTGNNAIKINRTISTGVTGNNLIRIDIGGKNINRPNISLLKIFNVNDFKWYYFEFNLTDNDYRLSGTKLIENVTDVSIPYSIKRYENNLYFVSLNTPAGINDNIIYFLNLDTFVFDEIDLRFNDKITPYPISNVAIDSKYLIVSGINDYDKKQIIFKIYNQVRSSDQVYRLSYNYDERVFPYQITTDRFVFRITLPNDTPIVDMEIFKWVIDFRIRYSKDNNLVNPTRPITDQNITDRRSQSWRQRNVNRQARLTGDVDKILGLVGEDFTVNDFLNIYAKI